MEIPLDEQLVCTYIKTRGLVVTTLRRRSSSMLAPDITYYESIVWSYDPQDPKKTREMVFGPEDSGSWYGVALESHSELVEKCFSGKPFEETDN